MDRLDEIASAITSSAGKAEGGTGVMFCVSSFVTARGSPIRYVYL